MEMEIDPDVAPKTKEECIAYLDECIKEINQLKDKLNKTELNEDSVEVIGYCIGDIFCETNFQYNSANTHLNLVKRQCQN